MTTTSIMKNPADLGEVCRTILEYWERGNSIKDVIEQTPYSEDELIYELALFYHTNYRKGTEHDDD